jgi:hypothetical protein
MGIKKKIVKKLVWPAVTTGTAWAAEKVMERGGRKVRGKKMAIERQSWGTALAMTAVSAAVAGVVGYMAEQGTDAAFRRLRGK